MSIFTIFLTSSILTSSAFAFFISLEIFFDSFYIPGPNEVIDIDDEVEEDEEDESDEDSAEDSDDQ